MIDQARDLGNISSLKTEIFDLLRNTKRTSIGSRHMSFEKAKRVESNKICFDSIGVSNDTCLESIGVHLLFKNFSS
jgi:hypothetical protein